MGELDALSGADSLFSAIGRGLENAFKEGQAECGIKADERTEEESKELTRLIGDNYQYVGRFVEWIVVHNKASGSPFEMIKGRVQLWIGRYEEVRAIAMTLSCANKKLLWRIGSTERHCKSCLKLNGRVHRALLWQRWDIYPRHRNLACHGHRCDCSFLVTDAPATKGRPPKIP